MTGLVGAALIAGAVALWQWRKNQALEREKLALEKEKIAWERDRLHQTWAHEEQERKRLDDAAAKEQEQAAAEAARLEQERERGIEENARRYRRTPARELSNLKILDMSRPLDLRSVYVHVRVRQQEPLKYRRDEEVERDSGGDVETRFAQRREAVSDPGVTVPPEVALTRFTRMVVLGDPGAGKTTMLRHLAFLMTQDESDTAPHLPVFIELRTFIDSGDSDLVHHIGETWARNYGFPDGEAYLRDRLSQGRVALLFDGLDEVLGGGTAEESQLAYARVSREIDRMATLYPDAPIAVTCRRHGWQGGLPAFHLLDALDEPLPTPMRDG